MSDTISADLMPRLAQAQRALQASQFATAAELVGELYVAAPNDPDVLYLAAVTARYTEDYDQAHTYLAALKQVRPEYGRAYQEEGHVFKALNQFENALRAYQTATRFNPALIASWQSQAELFSATGQTAAAANATAQGQRIQALPPALSAVTNHLYEGRLIRAEEIARAFLQKHPQHIEGMRLLADIGSRLGIHGDADFLLETAIALDPENIQLRLDHIQILRKRQKFDAARAQARTLLEHDSDNPVFQSLFAIESMQAGDYETALTMFDRVLEQRPNDPATLTSRGHALKTYGKTDLAITSYRGAIAANPQQGDAWYALANLKTYRFSDEEMLALENLQASPDLDFMSRVHIAFALGKAFEDAQAYDRAFKQYHAGNALKNQQSRYTSAQMDAECQAQKQYCTRTMLERQAGQGDPAPDPIFIVGLPRAGSTLIEQILASHSQVEGTLELPNILSLAHRLRGRKIVSDRDRYPRILGELEAEALQQLGQDYIENTRIHRSGAAYFTDKMPNNFRHIGLIHLILPNAKIIDARRAPMDCCWSGFKQLFAEGQEFTYGLEEIGHYYQSYMDLMQHWNAVLPAGRILTVQHEDVLDDLEGQVRRILAYCGLDFEPACLNFHTNQRAVRTASSEQVRQPLNRGGQDQWRPFESFLDPLKNALGPYYRETVGYSA